MSEYVVCRAGDLPPGGMRMVEVDGREIGVFNVGGEFYALRNYCPHRGAPLCRGKVTGLMTGPEPGTYELTRDGEIIRCPWHGYEFDITTGEFVVDSEKIRSITYDISVEPPDELDSRDVESLIECEFGETDVEVETYDVTVDDDLVVVHV